MRKWVLVLLLIVPGLLVMGVCGYYVLIEWNSLNAAHARFESLIAHHADLRRLFIVHAQEALHRINAFAEGVGFLLGALLAGLGVHGLCVMDDRSRT